MDYFNSRSLITAVLIIADTAGVTVCRRRLIPGETDLSKSLIQTNLITTELGKHLIKETLRWFNSTQILTNTMSYGHECHHY